MQEFWEIHVGRAFECYGPQRRHLLPEVLQLTSLCFESNKIMTEEGYIQEYFQWLPHKNGTHAPWGLVDIH